MKARNSGRKKVVIVGGGPASMILAAELDAEKYEVFVFDKNAALGRKFLVAGKGGFNLTHSETLDELTKRYLPPGFLNPALHCFTNTGFREWLAKTGIETYVGTSKRVFPIKGTKPIEVLKSIEKKLEQNKVKVFLDYEWRGFGETGTLVFSVKQKQEEIKFDLVIFALGGASWKVTGSDGAWLNYFSEIGITTKEFEASNCAFKIEWSDKIKKETEGKALKNCSFSCGTKTQIGEAVLTAFGIEGSGVYPLGAEVRKQLKESGKAVIRVDFKPGLSEKEIELRFDTKRNRNVKEILLQKLNLTTVQCNLLKHATSKEQYTDPAYLSKLIKSLPLMVVDLAPIDEAISTVGGIDLNEVNETFELKKIPGHYCIGEMLDWDAPTGGYLLQGCFSMGYYLAKKLNEK